MKKVDIIEVYGSSDPNCCMGALQTYMYVDGEIVISGDEAKNIDDMIVGAKAALYHQGVLKGTTYHRISNSELYAHHREDPEFIYNYVTEDHQEEEKTSSYGNF